MTTEIGTNDLTYGRDIDSNCDFIGTTTIHLPISSELGDMVTDFTIDYANFDIVSCELLVWPTINPELKTFVPLGEGSNDLTLHLIAMNNVKCFIKFVINDMNAEVTPDNRPKAYASYSELDEDLATSWLNDTIEFDGEQYIEGICHMFNGTSMM